MHYHHAGNSMNSSNNSHTPVQQQQQQPQQQQQQQRRRKKRPNYGTRTVEVKRGYNLDFGFTISGQQPCRLSCIVSNSPADLAGLRPGDFLITVNGLNVSKLPHETVVQLIGNSFGSIRMQIAENYFSDSSDEENAAQATLLNASNGSPFRATMAAGVRTRPRYLHHRAKMHRLRNSPQKKRNQQTAMNSRLTCSAPKSVEPTKPPLRPLIEDLPLQSATTRRAVQPALSVSADVANVSAMVRVVPSAALEYRAIVGYLGTIEMPKQISHSSKLQTVRSCIRKLRQEKRQPMTVLITILPDCLRLQAANGNILATYPSARLNYVSSSSESENRFFGLVTSAVHTSQADEDEEDDIEDEVDDMAAAAAGHMEPIVKAPSVISISNSCHVFVVDTKLCDHQVHLPRANEFRIQCTRDPISSLCLEFPRHAEYVVNLIRSMYTMRILPPATRQPAALDDVAGAAANGMGGLAAAHSPQPSNHSEISTTTSNSDSGIGFHNDCINISERILVVDFPGNRMERPPIQMPPPTQNNTRPLGIFNHIDPIVHNRLTVRAMPDPKIDLSATKTTTSTTPLRANARPDLLASFNLIKSPGTCLNATRSCDDVLGLVDSSPLAATTQYDDGCLPMSHASMDDLALVPSSSNNCFLTPSGLPPYKRYENNFAASETYAFLEDCRSGSRRSLQASISTPHKLSPQVFITPKMLATSKAITTAVTTTTPTKSSTSRYALGLSCIDTASATNVLNEQCKTPSTAPAAVASTSTLFDFDLDTWSSLQNLHAMVQHEYQNQMARALEATNSEPDLGNRAIPSNASPFRRAWGQSSFRTSRTDKHSHSPLQQQTHSSNNGSPLVRRAASMTASDNDVYIKSMNGYVDELKQAQLKKLRGNNFGNKATPTTTTTATTEASTAAAAASNNNGTTTSSVSFKTPKSTTSHHKTDANEECGATTAGVASWGTSFERLLEDAAGLHTFSEFLKKEFSAENIYFWTACERYRQTEDQAERATQARYIFNKYLANGSYEPVNVDSRARNLTEEKLQNAEPDIFVPAQKQVLNLMKFDSYQRFIRSDLYKSCQEAEEKHRPLPYTAEDLDELLRLSVHQNGGSAGAASKLKKSASNAEDRRRKSLLPWHRKTRSKSRDRCEADTNKTTNNNAATQPSKLPLLTTSSSLKIPSAHNSLSDIHSSRSSLSSFDAVTSSSGQVQTAEIACSLCRIILSDGATTIVQTRADETVGQLVERLLEKRGLHYKYYDVVATCGNSKSIDLQSNALQMLAGKEVLIEQRVAFKIDLPDPKVISVKSKPKKALHEVIRPILHKYNYEMDAVQVYVRDTQTLLDLSLQVTAVDGQRLQIVVQRSSVDAPRTTTTTATPDYQNACATSKFVRPSPLLKSCSATMVPTPFTKSNSIAAARNGVPQSTLDEITNKVFNELLQCKVDAHAAVLHERQQLQHQQSQVTKISDLCSIKSDDCASETSSVFERIRRRDSSNIPAPRIRNKKKSISSQNSEEALNGHNATTMTSTITMTLTTMTTTMTTSQPPTTTTTTVEMKKPIIAKLKAGVKLQVTERVNEHPDDLLEGLKRAQLARLEDQRGTEINFELPEFLKHKENISAAASKLRKVRANLSPINTKVSESMMTSTASPITTTTTTHINSPKLTLTNSLPSLFSSTKIVEMSRPQPAPRLSITNRQKSSACSVSPMKIDEEEIVTTPNISLEENANCNDTNMLSTEQTNIENGKGPPPLPPKPKVLPIKPSNWGASSSSNNTNGASKIPIDINRKLSTSNGEQLSAYLEEPTSSFV